MYPVLQSRLKRHASDEQPAALVQDPAVPNRAARGEHPRGIEGPNPKELLQFARARHIGEVAEQARRAADEGLATDRQHMLMDEDGRTHCIRCQRKVPSNVRKWL